MGALVQQGKQETLLYLELVVELVGCILYYEEVIKGKVSQYCLYGFQTNTRTQLQ